VDLVIAELFGNARIPQLAERYYSNEKVDSNNEFLIKISYSAKFTPKHYTPEEWELWMLNAKKGAGPERQRSKVSQLTAEKPASSPSAVHKETRLSPLDYQGRDLFDLPLPSAPLFPEQPKGVVVIQIQGIDIKWSSGQAKRLFMLISNGKEINRTKSVESVDGEGLHWGKEIVKMSTQDPGDKIYFRLYDEADASVVLAEGTLTLLLFLGERRAFSTTKATVSFKVYE
jgi:hypothetical protein